MSSYALNVLNTYYNTPRTAYVGTRHLREVLHRLEQLYGVNYHGSRQDDYEMLSHINSYYTREQVAPIHYKVANELPKKGRPRWATNKERAPSVDNLDELRRLQEMVSQYKKAAETVREAVPQQTNGVDHSTPTAAVDLSAYLTRSEFATHERAQTDAFVRVRSDIDGLQDQINAFEAAKPTLIHIQPTNLDKPAIDLGLQHFVFPDLIMSLQARQFNGLPLNAWLYGPAGTGKSKACETAIKAFGKQFYGNGKTLDKIELLGYKDGYGTYHRTQFRDAFEHGHGYCADEIDSWSPEATTALQGALAGDWAAFPDGMVKRHPDFIFIAAGNTTGKGATIEYVGRMQQDAAFLDRFAFLEWPHDDTLEDAIISNKDWLAYVRKVRSRLATSDIRNHLVTMRASINGEALLAAGMAWDKTVNMCLRKGLPQNNWDKIK